MKTLIIDNYDSYTFNLYQLIAEVNGEYPTVITNKFAWGELKQGEFDNIVISPGPGRPENLKDFGICLKIIQNAQIPLLGVCLGHQGLGYGYGGKVIYAPEVRHGRLSEVYHNGNDLFVGIPSPFSVVRYHSLLVSDNLSECLEKVAWTEDKLVMGISHRSLPLWGVQFHPESICTQYGKVLFENFKKITRKFAQKRDKIPKKNYWIVNRKNTSLPINYSYQKQQQKFELCTRKLNICPDSEEMFVHLFGKSSNAFWLDSSLVETGLSRFSFMGDSSGENSLLIHYRTRSAVGGSASRSHELTITQSNTVTFSTEGIFEYLQREIEHRNCPSDDLPFDFNCGFVGYFGYEIKAECGSQVNHSSTLRDAMFLLADRMIAIDHQERTLYLLCLIQQGQATSADTWFETIKNQIDNLSPLLPIVCEKKQTPIIFELSRSQKTYLNDIQVCLQEIHEGETYQVCLTNQIHTHTTPNPLAFYQSLRRINPAPYSAFLRFGDVAMPAAGVAIACSSPERFLHIDRQGWVETKPIKGTSPREKTPEEDFILRERLQNSEKDRAENLMIVDLLRNDLGKVCEVGTVHVPKLMDVETYATLHQLVTTIRGHLRAEMSAIDCIRHAFPGGSMTGAPKLRTLEIIDRLEQEARGVYSGAIGFLGLNGSADLNIVIRTAVLTTEKTSIGIGGGIVALSDAQMEFQETLLKAKALIHAMLMTTHGAFDPNQYYIKGIEAELPQCHVSTICERSLS